MLYKKILKKHHNWLKFFDKKLSSNEYQKNYYAWIIISNHDLIKKNSELISPFLRYESNDAFFSILMSVVKRGKEEHLINSFFNKDLKEKLFNLRNSYLFFQLYISMEKKDFIKFVKEKILAFNNKEEFTKYLKSFLYWNNNWDKKFLFKHIYDNRIFVEKCYDSDNIVILELKDFGVAKSIGTHNWCISRQSKYFDIHKYTFDRLFFIYDFNKKQYDESALLGVTISPGTFLNIKYVFNSLNEQATLGDHRDILQYIVLGDEFDPQKFLDEVLSFKDKHKAIELLIEHEFLEEAISEFNTLVKSRSEEFVSTLYFLVYTQKKYDFLFKCIDSGVLRKRDITLIIDVLCDFINEVHVSFDSYFLQELFEKLNNNDYVLNMARRLTEKKHSFRHLRYLLVYVLNGKFDSEYIIHYALKTKSFDVFKIFLSDSIMENINLFYFLSLLSDEEFNSFYNIAFELIENDPHVVSHKIINRLKYVKLKKIKEKHSE